MFVRNFNITPAASGTVEVSAKYQYLRTLVCVKVFRLFDFFTDNVECTQTLNIDDIIRDLTQYFSTVKLPSKQKLAMRQGMKNHAL